MKNRNPKINDRKLRGEWAEMYFMACAAEHGLHVNKPYGEMSHFDFVIGDHGCLLRVQVKSTLARLGTGYECTVRGGHRAYTGDVFDFLAALIVPELVWYIIPAELALGHTAIALYPSSKKSKYAPYKEAWHLLRPRECALRGTLTSIEACADDLSPMVPPADSGRDFASK
jgi:DNA-binding transcriptional LysR family regulator